MATIMVKLLLLIALGANISLIVSASDTKSKSTSYSSAASYSGSSSSAASSTSASDSSSSNGANEDCVEIQVCTQPNEEYDICPRTCPPQTCESLDMVYICPIVKPCDRICKPACVCKPGYYRNAIGECISKEQCRKCCGPNEYYSCGGACDNVCAYLSIQNQTCCPIVNIKCNEMCYCKEGHARDDNGICVPFDQCPQPCKGCKGDPNAHRGCGINCGRHCSDLNEPDGVACVAMCYYPYGCDCNDGYVLDDNTGKCVLPCECTPGANISLIVSASGTKSNSASYSSSAAYSDSSSSAISSSATSSSAASSSTASSTSASGSSSSSGGNEDCGEIQVCTQPNEVYDMCPSTCPPQTCESLDRVYICPIVEPCDRVCEPACVCRPGYYRNAIGECISKEQCRKCCGPNEYYSCGGACDNVCAYLSIQNQTCCPIVNIKCNEMCYCKEGHARDDNGICVPFDQCPQPCKGCKGDPNAHRGCGINCGRHCSDLNEPDEVACIAICYRYGCDCNDGYVLDDNIGKCVLPCDCTPTCGENEEFSLCVQGPDCSPEDCEPGCVCIDGYRRAWDGTCVLIEDYCE